MSRSRTSPDEAVLHLPPSLSTTTTLRPEDSSASPTSPASPRRLSFCAWIAAARQRRAAERERAKVSEKRRLAEEERAIAERAIAERIKRESAAGPSAAEAELRLLQLKDDVLEAGAAAPPRSTAGLFKAVCSTDLLFLMDTTGSMGPYIRAAKDQVKSIVDDLMVAFFNEADVRIAVVGYKDHMDSPNIQFLDFTPDADRVRSFLDELRASGGDDTPEDVLGGIRQALSATWKQQTRCIIHIADAPPHGRIWHDWDHAKDNYLNPGSEPHGLTHEVLLKQMIELNINYALLRINNYTDRMAMTFLQAYAAASPNCKLHKANYYYSQACRVSASFRRGSMRSAKARLQFEEVELGTTYNALRHLVVKSVTTSTSRTAVGLSASAARATEAGFVNMPDLQLEAIKEDEDDVDAELETTPPQWDKPGWLGKKLMVDAFSADVVMHGASTLDDLMAHDDNNKISTTELTIYKRSWPFAQGAIRVATYACTAASTNRLVVKSFKRGGKQLPHLIEDMRCQALCKAFALEFNALLGEEYSIDFIMVTCLKPKGTASGDECMTLEPFIHGTYVKYNSNSGYVNEDNPNDPVNQAAQAFSHFTFERSRGYFLISDLQGVGHLLTDPAIHTLDPQRFKLADTNLGQDGFKFFFATHKCNAICHKLGLKTNASMIMSGKYDFRETWPGMGTGEASPKGKVTNMMICCSNKLCSRIVRVATAKKSDQFPGYHWCDACWPQLFSSMVKLICLGSGPYHEFDMSKFFYESQGQIIPHQCPGHRASPDFVPKTATVALGLPPGEDAGAGGCGMPVQAVMKWLCKLGKRCF
jgi:hypothetical protein